MDINPLLENPPLPDFSRIKTDHMEAAIDSVLVKNASQLSQLAEQQQAAWNDLFPVLEEMGNRLSKSWSPIGHLNAVVNDAAVRDAYNACLTKVTDYNTMLSQHGDLYRLIKSTRHAPEFANLTKTQKKILNDTLLDFRLSGVDLAANKRKEFRKLANELAALQAKFEENVLDATHAWSLHVSDTEKLRGMPSNDLDVATERAKTRDLPGWILTLDYPCYHAVITFADDRLLRNEIFEAYATRASDNGPNSGQFDNTVPMRNILALRARLAELLGFGCAADYSLQTKMVRSTGEVRQFLETLLVRIQPQAQREYLALCEYASSTLSLHEMQPWDVAYVTEKLRQDKHAIDQETLRVYFPVEQVLQGMFRVIGELYGLRIEAVEDADVWHRDVQLFELFDHNNDRLGHLYTDLFARKGKRSGAWMDEYCNRYRVNGDLQTPVAFLVCNFSPSGSQGEALLTHDNVITLFHEFGHCLHHLLTQIEYPSVAGINGVEWDAVELPSQFHENFAWERKTLCAVSRHVSTGETLPDDMITRLLAARNFQSALFLLRQLEFALFDIELHSRNDGPGALQTWREVRKRVAVNTLPDYHRFPNSFSHIFAGGYAAGYYGYLWAEVLANDAYYNVVHSNNPRAEARRFRSIVLAQGGSRPAAELFQELMHREPDIEAFLRHHGI
ncbi:MAG: M3 family metallopeptidase, partial [Gammaproteobacteria bacterium]